MFLIVRSHVFCPRPLRSHQDPQRLSPPLQEVGATAQACPLAGVSLTEWLTQHQTQMEITCLLKRDLNS